MHEIDSDTRVLPTLYTIGHSNRSLDELIEQLNEFQIKQLIDIRTVPDSRNRPMFNRTPFSLACSDEGIAYTWLGRELGGLRRPKPNSQHTALNTGLRSFADHMETAIFQRGIQQVCQLAHHTRTVLMCAERDPSQCHRNMIADYLSLKHWQVVHIINHDKVLHHHINPLVRCQNQTLIYDQLTQEQLDFSF